MVSQPVTQMAMWASRGGQLIQRQVSTWGVLRNSAAHNYAGYDETQVAQMLQSVQKFAADYLAYIRRPNAPVPADPPPKAAVGG